MAANIQNAAQLMDFIKQHPGLSALATSTVAGPLLGLWKHDGAPIPGYGRLLTQIEAHSALAKYTPELMPSPNIPPVFVFGHPETISYSPAPPSILLKPRPRKNFPATSASGQLSRHSCNSVATIEHSAVGAACTFPLASGLVVLMGIATIVALCINALNSWSHKKKAISDTELIGFLQLELQKAKDQNKVTQEDLSKIQERLRGVQNNLSAAQTEVTTMKIQTNSLSEIQKKLHSVQDDLATAEVQIGSTEEELKSTRDYLDHVQVELKQKEVREQEMMDMLHIADQEASDLRSRAAKDKLNSDYMVVKLRESNAMLPDKIKRISDLEAETEKTHIKLAAFQQAVQLKEEVIEKAQKEIKRLDKAHKSTEKSLDRVYGECSVFKKTAKTLETSNQRQKEELEKVKADTSEMVNVAVKNCQEEAKLVRNNLEREHESVINALHRKREEAEADLQNRHRAEIEKLSAQLSTAEGKLAFHTKNASLCQEEVNASSEHLAVGDSTSAKGKIDRVDLDPAVKWTSRNLRESWRWAVRVGIVQQGPYPDKELILLELPATDPFYSKLPVAVPKPCDESYTGSKDTCNHCEQPYSKKDLHRHAPSCIIFFSQHAVICDHCRKVFVKNGAFLLHEKQCTNSQQQHYAQSNLSYRSSKAPSAEPTASLPWGFNQLYNPSANTHPGSLS
jgi:hypothetical protein